MIRFKAEIRKFQKQGEKTGWTYIEIPLELAQQLIPGNKKSFRVKGRLDDVAISGMALLPMGGGDFILPLKADLRKLIRKPVGEFIEASLQVDKNEPQPPAEMLECFEEDTEARDFFFSLPKGHQNYFIKWIESAKTEETRMKRIVQAVNALGKKWGYPETIRASKNDKLKGW